MGVTAFLQLPLIALLLFHCRIVWLRVWTGEFHSTYMILPNPKTDSPNGKEAYLDQRALAALQRMVDLQFMDQSVVWRVWLASLAQSKSEARGKGLVRAMSVGEKTIVEASLHRQLTRE
eukprot:TRINITY_DN33651_c0_g1_i1.p1 TRINITY_DN33651_c0_g1~~TRINITY_DN33651_c0_g1_i1.p1  ORF type:complete len:119 (-),score=20.08 TRINITY_DN33651_c0_g1_i1:106-462(-)